MALTPRPDSVPGLLDATLDWLAIHLGWFRPPFWARYLTRRPFEAQPALELLLLARCLPRGSRAETTQELVGAALDVAEEIVAGPGFRHDLDHADHMFPYHAFLLGLLHAGGRAQPELCALAQERADRYARQIVRGMVHLVQAVELRYAFELAGVATELRPMDELAARAAHRLPADVADCGDDDAYGLTHLVLYATDLGATPLPGVDPGVLDDRTLGLLRRYLDAPDHDLSAELLLCADVLGCGDAPVVDEGWRRLTAAQHADGAVPSPPFDPDFAETLFGAQYIGYRFAMRYHTTLVTAIAGNQWEARVGGRAVGPRGSLPVA